MGASSRKHRFSDQHVDIADHKRVWHWMTATAREDTEGFIRLTGPNVERLKTLYGPPHWTSDGSQGWTQAWAVAISGLNFIVTSGPHGTMFYVRVPTDGEDYLADPRVAVGVIEFLRSLLKQLRYHY